VIEPRAGDDVSGAAELRPSYGRYPDDGIMPLSTNNFDQVGPLARGVADLALFVTGEISEPAKATMRGQ
jgi:mandelamide amidase